MLLARLIVERARAEIGELDHARIVKQQVRALEDEERAKDQHT